MQLIQKDSPNKSTRNDWKPDVIVFHITDGNYNGAVSWLCNSSSNVSAHFVVSRQGEITQLVDLSKMAWANGTNMDKSDKRYYGNSLSEIVRGRKTNANYYTVSIETEGFSETTGGNLTASQLNSIIELVQYIREEVKRIYNIIIPLDRQHLIGHNEVTPITKPYCPGSKFPFDEIIYELSKRESGYEMIDEGKFKVNGKIIEMERIFKDDINYVKISDLKKADFEIYYDEKDNLPIINSPK